MEAADLSEPPDDGTPSSPAVDFQPSDATPDLVSVPLTFNRDVAPIIYERCVVCHRPDEVAPFPLMTFSEVADRASQIADVVQSRYMPPWLPEPGHGDFIGERRLTDLQIDVVRRWANSDRIEGDPADLPPFPEFPKGWLLGQPDLQVRMPEPYPLVADGSDIFRTFVIPLPIKSARYVKAVEMRPGNPRVVHHANLRVDRTRLSRQLDEEEPGPGFGGMEGPGFGGMEAVGEARSPDGQFVGWTPGSVPKISPRNTAWRLDEGADLVVQLHLLPSGKPETVQSTVGLFFTDTPPDTKPVQLRLGSQTIDIPAGESRYEIHDRFELPVDVELLNVYPHAHYLAKTMQGKALLPDGTEQWLIRIDDWDFNWQDQYHYRVPIRLPKGTVLEMRYVYDNSAANERNPTVPPRRVVYGPHSSDEMGDLWLQVLAENDDDRYTLERAFQAKDREARFAGVQMAVRLHPQDAYFRHLLGCYQMYAGKLADAAEQLREAVRLKPDYSTAHNSLGFLLQRQGKLDEAVDQFQQAVRTRPKNVYAHNNLGDALRLAGRLDEAERHFRQAIQIWPEFVEAHANLGLVQLVKGNTEEATQLLRKAIRLNPDNAHAQNNLAAALAREGKLEEAIHHYREALKADPQNAIAYSNLGALLATQGTSTALREAVSLFGKAIEQSPNKVETRQNMARALMLLKDYGRAATELQEIVRLSPDNAVAHVNLAIVLKQIGDLPGAIVHLRRAVELAPDQFELQYQLGRLLAQSGSTAAAIAPFRAVLIQQPGHRLAKIQLAWILATHADSAVRNETEALRLAQEASQDGGDTDPDSLDTLAVAYAAVGRFDEAEATAMRAIQLARQAKREQAARAIEARRELYLAGKPFRQ